MSLSRHLVFWSVAARNVGRFSTRVIAVAVPLLVVMAFSAAMTFIKDGLVHDALAATDSLPDITVRRLEGGRMAAVDDALQRDIERQPGVRAVAPRVWGAVPTSVDGGTVVYTLMGIDPARATLAPDLSLALDDGRFLTLSDRGNAVIGRLFADRYHLAPGAHITLSDQRGNATEITVIGVLHARVNVYSADLIITDIDTAREFFGYPRDRATDLCVYVETPDAADQIATSLQLLRHNLQALPRSAQADAARQTYAARSGVFQLMWLVLLLTVVLLAWAQASSVSMEMRREIGVLKALGWQTLDIIEVKMMETVIVATAATAAGILAGLAFVWAGAPLLPTTILGWSALYPAFPVPLRVEASSVFVLLVTGVLPLCGATIFPAWLLGITEPDTAIRSG